MTDPKIITNLRAVIAPGSCHLDVRLSRGSIVELLAGWDALQSSRDDAEISESLALELLDKARPDAARYRWLLSRPEGMSPVDVVRWDDADGTTVCGEQMTQAIDAAMKEQA